MKLGGHEIGNRERLLLIAGPCVIEGESMALETAAELAAVAGRLGMPFVFKASFDKANRTSHAARRGPGLAEGLGILAEVKERLSIPVLTDVHETGQVAEVAKVADVLQTPAFLVRQTDFIQTVARAARPMNVKKGQFLAPWDMEHVVAKCRAVGNDQVMVCERGVSFGYNNLVADMRSLAWLRATGCPVVFDATHSVQEPGGLGAATGGKREMIPVLARSAVAAGVAGVFFEIHPDPERAWSDGPNQWPLARSAELLSVLVEIDRVVKAAPWPEERL